MRRMCEKCLRVASVWCRNQTPPPSYSINNTFLSGYIITLPMLLSMTLSSIRGRLIASSPIIPHISIAIGYLKLPLTIAFPFFVCILPPMYYITVVASIENQVLLSNHLEIQIRQEAQSRLHQSELCTRQWGKKGKCVNTSVIVYTVGYYKVKEKRAKQGLTAEG